MNGARAAAAALETTATGLWVGASVGFAFISAPVAFGLVTDRDVFAQITERSLERTARLTYVAGGIAAACALARAGFERDGRRSELVRAGASAAALGLIAYHQRAIVPAMARTQAALGGFADAAKDDPRRIAYRAQHQRSTRVYGLALLLGTIHLVLAALRAPAADDGTVVTAPHDASATRTEALA